MPICITYRCHFLYVNFYCQLYNYLPSLATSDMTAGNNISVLQWYGFSIVLFLLHLFIVHDIQWNNDDSDDNSVVYIYILVFTPIFAYCIIKQITRKCFTQTAWKVVSSGRTVRRILVSHSPSSGFVSNSTSTNDAPATAVPTVSPCDDTIVGGCVASSSGRPSILNDCRLACTLNSKKHDWLSHRAAVLRSNPAVSLCWHVSCT